MTQINLNIFPETFRNEQFEDNLAYFKTAQPAIYNAVVNHRCKDYRLCTNPDGSPNIFETKSNAPVYSTFEHTSFQDAINKSIADLAVTASIPNTYFGGGRCALEKQQPDSSWHA